MKLDLTPTMEEAIEHIARDRRITVERTMLALVDYALAEALLGDAELVFDRDLVLASGRAAPRRKKPKPAPVKPAATKKRRAAREAAVVDELVETAAPTRRWLVPHDDSGRPPQMACSPTPAAGAPETPRGGDG